MYGEDEEVVCGECGSEHDVEWVKSLDSPPPDNYGPLCQKCKAEFGLNESGE